MLEKLKEMQKQGIFKISNSGIQLNEQIENASSDSDIKDLIPKIKNYIKEVDSDLSIRANAPFNDTIADFNDKIQLELYDMFKKTYNVKGGLYETELDCGQNVGKAKIALKSSNINFTLEERKILKLINNNYILLSSKKDFKGDLIYIPMKELDKIFKETNHKVKKDIIISTCSRLQEKIIYWDYSKTRYAETKKLNDKNIAVCKGDKLVDISILYYPYDKAGNMQLKGIICKVNNFMKLRFAIKQISYLFPAAAIKEDYLEYCIISRLVYHMNFTINKKREYFVKSLYQLLKDINYYKNGNEESETYFSVVNNDKHKPREIKKLISAFITIAADFKSNNTMISKCELNVNIYNRSNIVVRKYNIDIMNNTVPRDIDDIYSELEKITGGADMEVKDINILCNKLKKLKISNLATAMQESKKTSINIRILQKFYENKTGDANIEELKNYLINNLSYTRGKIYDMLQNIELKIYYKLK
jgi:hypothetical protein